MTDLEINKALALAIGWPFVTTEFGVCQVRDGADYFFWNDFDYCDWNVIGPIAARYDVFPRRYSRNGSVYDGTWVTNQTHYFADTPQKAIALAVIEGAKK